MAVHQPLTEATVELQLRVPRGAVGDLVAGVRDVLKSVADVEDVTVEGVSNVHPSPADLYVDTTVTLALATIDDDPESVRRHVRDGFGVESVARVEIE